VHEEEPASLDGSDLFPLFPPSDTSGILQEADRAILDAMKAFAGLSFNGGGGVTVQLRSGKPGDGDSASDSDSFAVVVESSAREETIDSAEADNAAAATDPADVKVLQFDSLDAALHHFREQRALLQKRLDSLKGNTEEQEAADQSPAS
jgi:hypothetical protein